MLDKKAEQVLKLVISKYNGDMEIPIYLHAEDFNIEYTELNELCSFLYKSGFLSDVYFAHSMASAVKVFLSHKGLHYFESKHQEQLKSIFTPVIISIITNLSIALIKWLFPLIIQWFSNYQ